MRGTSARLDELVHTQTAVGSNPTSATTDLSQECHTFREYLPQAGLTKVHRLNSKPAASKTAFLGATPSGLAKHRRIQNRVA